MLLAPLINFEAWEGPFVFVCYTVERVLTLAVDTIDHKYNVVGGVHGLDGPRLYLALIELEEYLPVETEES